MTPLRSRTLMLSAVEHRDRYSERENKDGKRKRRLVLKQKTKKTDFFPSFATLRSVVGDSDPVVTVSFG